MLWLSLFTRGEWRRIYKWAAAALWNSQSSSLPLFFYTPNEWMCDSDCDWVSRSSSLSFFFFSLFTILYFSLLIFSSLLDRTKEEKYFFSSSSIVPRIVDHLHNHLSQLTRKSNFSNRLVDFIHTFVDTRNIFLLEQIAAEFFNFHKFHTLHLVDKKRANEQIERL